jgi:hypothetical protein
MESSLTSLPAAWNSGATKYRLPLCGYATP